jgi:hypothetical protein
VASLEWRSFSDKVSLFILFYNYGKLLHAAPPICVYYIPEKALLTTLRGKVKRLEK